MTVSSHYLSADQAIFQIGSDSAGTKKLSNVKTKEVTINKHTSSLESYKLVCAEEDWPCPQPFVRRLTPEQISNRIFDSFGHRRSFLDDGFVYDEVVDGYGVILGGINYGSVHRRNQTVKVSTILAAHAVAWLTATDIVFRDFRHADDGHGWLLFTDCNPEWDTPKPLIAGTNPGGENEERAARWHKQLESLFWRAFSRAPTEREAYIYGVVFHQATVSEINIQKGEKDYEHAFIRGWIAVLYTMLSSVEFWVV